MLKPVYTDANSRSVDAGDARTFVAARAEARSQFEKNKHLSADSREAEEAVNHAEGVAQILKANVVQGISHGGADEEHYSMWKQGNCNTCGFLGMQSPLAYAIWQSSEYTMRQRKEIMSRLRRHWLGRQGGRLRRSSRIRHHEAVQVETRLCEAWKIHNVDGKST